MAGFGAMIPSDGFAVLRLDDAAASAIPVSAEVGDWIPVRRQLDVRAFGINVWIARSAGDVAVESHDEAEEDGPGQEEVYVVLRGAARFTVGDETFDAGQGDLVYVRDPALRRGATALEDETTTLSVGGRRGAFEPSGWEGRWLRELGHGDE
jgi:hypothetical protein